MSYLDYLTVKESPAETYARKTALYSIFDRLGRELEMPPSRYEEANKRYIGVSDWLQGCDKLGCLEPVMFGQGSFALGTTVRPLHGDEFDVDFIGHLQLAHPQLYTQQQVYDLFLNRLRAHGDYVGMVQLMKRCVRLCYANEFHLDITPAVSNPACLRGSLFVPDRKLAIWKDSHPKGYADWFKDIAKLKPRFTTLSKSFSEGRHVALSTEPLPEQQAPRGVLRRAVQVMKRHRDTFREKHPRLAEYAPISIIITTLATHAYELAVALNEYDSEFDLMHAVIALMPRFIVGPDRTGCYLVKNPSNDGENFADKWREPQYHLVFTQWHQALQRDLRALEKLHGQDELQKSLRDSLGSTEVDRVFSNQLQQLNQGRQQGRLSIAAAATAATVSAPVKASIPLVTNTFYGQA